MKSFLTTCLYFLLPVLAAAIAIGFMADGYTDSFYLRFSSPPQTSLIIGTSKAAQGLQPTVLNKALAGEYPQADLYNFSFTLNNSPFGQVYLDAIRRKLKADAQKGVFIVTLDPWAVADLGQVPENESTFRESNGVLGKTMWMNAKPNFSYLLSCYNDAYTRILITRLEVALHHPPRQHVHEDGWLEISPLMDSASVAGRMQNLKDNYLHGYLPHASISPSRKASLIETVAFLKMHGDVYLVRMPVHPDLVICDNIIYPHFDAFADSIAHRFNIPYFNFTDSCARYTYTDGLHLWKGSGALLSKQLAQLIINYRHPR